MELSHEQRQEVRSHMLASEMESNGVLEEKSQLKAHNRQHGESNIDDISNQNPMSDCHIFRLPDELLSMIVDFHHDEKPGTECLRELRSIHSRFANLQGILRLLFRRVVVGPHRYRITRSLLKIAPFVREILIEPARIGTYDEGGQGKDHVLSPWREAMASGAVTKAMAKVFNALTHAKEFAIYEISHDEEFEVYSHTSFPSGGAIYALALESITRAKVRPSQLTFFLNDETNYGPTWLCSDEVWHNLDLDGLQKLRFEGLTPPCDDVLYNLNIPALLSKSAASLQEVVFQNLTVDLPRQSVNPPILALRRVSIVDTLVGVPEFADWISQCAVLQELVITHEDMFFDFCVTNEDRPSFTVWRPLFESIRNHPSRMTLNFSPLRVTTCVYGEAEGVLFDKDHKFFVDHNTADACHETSFRKVDDDEVNRKSEIVINYMSGFGEWTLGETD